MILSHRIIGSILFAAGYISQEPIIPFDELTSLQNAHLIFVESDALAGFALDTLVQLAFQFDRSVFVGNEDAAFTLESEKEMMIHS